MIDKSVLYRYTVKEDIFNAISHGIGVIFALWGVTYLSYLSDNTTEYVVALIYGFSLLFMFLCSTLYHSIFNYTTRGIFKRLDHCAIFVLITGSYTPYIFLCLNTTSAYVTYFILILITIIGIVLKVFYAGRFKVFSTILYIMMGWIVIFQIKDLIAKVDSEVLIYLLLGGIVYTVGAIFYAFAKFKYHHFVWHIFVFVAALLQFYSIYLIYKS